MKLRASAMAARIWSAVRAAPSPSAGIGGSTQRLWAKTGVALANKAAIRKKQRTRPSFGIDPFFGIEKFFRSGECRISGGTCARRAGNGLGQKAAANLSRKCRKYQCAVTVPAE